MIDHYGYLSLPCNDLIIKVASQSRQATRSPLIKSFFLFCDLGEVSSPISLKIFYRISLQLSNFSELLIHTLNSQLSGSCHGSLRGPTCLS